MPNILVFAESRGNELRKVALEAVTAAQQALNSEPWPTNANISNTIVSPNGLLPGQAGHPTLAGWMKKIPTPRKRNMGNSLASVTTVTAAAPSRTPRTLINTRTP